MEMHWLKSPFTPDSIRSTKGCSRRQLKLQLTLTHTWSGSRHLDDIQPLAAASQSQGDLSLRYLVYQSALRLPSQHQSDAELGDERTVLGMHAVEYD